MKLDKLAGSGNDEYYTPNYAIKPILKYIKPNSTIWCPFDTEKSNYVKLFNQNGHKVINTHIETGDDFFKCDVPECDYIISNPPYSVKTEVFERLFSIGKPFAMLVGGVGLFENKKRFNMFKNNTFEIMYLSKRVRFLLDYNGGNSRYNPPFQSVYLCGKMLPTQIVFEEIGESKKDVKQLNLF